MKKLNFILTLLLLAVGATWAMADDHTLSLGNYDEVVAQRLERRPIKLIPPTGIISVSSYSIVTFL